MTSPQEALDQAAADLKQARSVFDSASNAYDLTRRNRGDLDQARTAWALAGQDWMTALIAHAAAHDAHILARRTA